MELAEFQISFLLGNCFRETPTRFKSKALPRKQAGSTVNLSLQEIADCMGCEIPEGHRGSAVTCLITDSRRVVPGALFFAIGGSRTNGNFYVEEAVDRGAVAVVSEEDLGEFLPVPCIRVSDTRLSLAVAARHFYEEPDAKLKISGITGTNGKTTVAMLVQHLMGGSRQIGMLGTVRYDLGGRTLPSFKTTPESVDTFALLDQMRGAGCAEAVLEVSSHGLDQKRVYGMAVEVAVFMNLTRDHIDYHESMEAYFQSKLTLFNGKNGSLPRAAVINLDCPYGQRLEKSLDRAVTAITFSLEGEADFVARKLKLYPDYTEFELDGPSGLIKVKSPLLGRYNVSNLLAALAVGHAQGFKLEDQLARLADFQAVPGRMERIDLKQSFNVLVDYAHTDDALTHACGMLRELTKGRCILVFGCGGDRDRSKRAPMLRAALSHADIILVTADNPRSEAQEQIFEDMRVALKEGSEDRVQFIPDRKRAISMALDLAQADDCVLVAGKGHETYQEFDGSVIPFDDRQMIRELWALKEKGSSAK